MALVGLGVIADALGLAAIVDRLMEYGVTPNRLVVMGSNAVFLGTLLTLLFRWIQSRGADMERKTRDVMNRALGVFVLWTACVILVFPVVYGWGLDQAEVAQFEEAATEISAVEDGSLN
jgi:hypothetical protein